VDRIEKKDMVASLHTEFANANTVVVVHYRGMTVEQLTELRKKMRVLGATLRITKNNLARLAVKGTQYEKLADMFVGPTAVAFSQDPVAAAKGVVEFTKNTENLIIVGGAANDDVMGPERVLALAKLPSLDELRAKLIGMITTPATRIACILQAPGAQIARVLNAYSQKA
jgi:large subunit ribosomal protein L10